MRVVVPCVIRITDGWRCGQVVIGPRPALPSMPSRRLSATARRFLAERIHSVLQLELVLLLARDPGRRWTTAAVAQELRGPEPWIAGQLTDLVDAGVARAPRDGAEPVAYARDGPWAAAIGEIDEQYRRRRTSVIRLIFASAAPDVPSLPEALRRRQDGQE
jgi:hypothetical protein